MVNKSFLRKLHQDCLDKQQNHNHKMQELVKILGGIDEILRYYLCDNIYGDDLYQLSENDLCTALKSQEYRSWI